MGPHPMDVLQASVPLLAMADPDLNDDSREANLARAVMLIARVASMVAAWQRIRHDKEPLPSDESSVPCREFFVAAHG